jgi:hypothetical protein
MYVYCSRSSPAWQTQEIPQTSFTGWLTDATSAQHPVAQRTACLRRTLQCGSGQRKLAKIICQDVSQLLAMGFPMLAMPCQWYRSQDLGDGPHSTPPMLPSAHVEVRLCSKACKGCSKAVKPGGPYARHVLPRHAQSGRLVRHSPAVRMQGRAGAGGAPAPQGCWTSSDNAQKTALETAAAAALNTPTPDDS